MSIPAGSASKIALSSRVVNHVLHAQAIAVDVSEAHGGAIIGYAERAREHGL